jgi:hypothetical protein
MAYGINLMQYWQNDFPRRDDGLPGRTHFPRPTAQQSRGMNRINTRRPPAHYDSDPLPNAPPWRGRPPPMFWAYPANGFDYSTQNRRGQHHGSAGSAGPFRVVTDRHQGIQGMITHPVGNPNDFIRAPERVKYRLKWTILTRAQCIASTSI